MKTKKTSIKKKLKTAAASAVIVAGVVTTGIISQPVNMVENVPSNPTKSQTTQTTTSKTEKNPGVEDSKTVHNDVIADVDYTKSDYKSSEVKPDGSQDVSNEGDTKIDLDKPDLSKYTVEIPYVIEPVSEYATSITINVPDELSIDIVDMMFKQDVVMSGILPNENKFTSIPLIFDNLNNISFKLHRLGNIVGDAIFIDDKLMTNVEVQR